MAIYYLAIIRYTQVDEMDFDVIIIGSGAGGGMTALSLCEQGFKVGLLERGKRFNPSKDYIQNYPNWARREDPLDSASRPEQTINRKYRTEYKIGDQELRRNANIYHRVHGLGGSTLHYQGEAHRFAEYAFNGKSEFGWGVDWPINYQDLAPYYQQAEKLLGVAGKIGNPFKPEREEFPTPAHALKPSSQIMAESAKRAGMSLLPNPLALPSQSVDGRLPCQHSGGCNFGCVFGAKSSIDQAIIPKAEKTGRLTILTESRVSELVLNAAGEITGIHYFDKETGANTQLNARAYVLAAGAVETPRLMLQSGRAQNESGYANQHDQVGRYFMETVIAMRSLQLKADIHTHRGPPLDSRIWDFARPIDNKTSGFVLGVTGYLYPGKDPVSMARHVQGVGRKHKQQVRARFGRDLLVFGVAEQEPAEQNRVFLSDVKDHAGIPMVNIHCEYSVRDRHTISTMQEKLSAWITATPSKKSGFGSSSLGSASATHVGGTCRMGSDPKHSVVDPWGKVHGQSNCYISDASVFPSQGAGDSPSLTIQALALRTADRIGADLKA